MMKKKDSCRWYRSPSVVLFALFVLLCIVTFIDYARDQPGVGSKANPSSVTIRTATGTVDVPVELALTEQEWKTGLMNRTSLGADEGMLFVFPVEGLTTFWMRYTKIPLDILFVRADGSIHKITEDAQPCTADPCELFYSEVPVQYVLEVNSGFAKRYGIKAGDRIEPHLS